MNYCWSSHSKLIGFKHIIEFCLFRNHSHNSSMQHSVKVLARHRGLNFKDLKHLTCVLPQDLLLKVSHKCPAMSTSRLLSNDGARESILRSKVNVNCGPSDLDSYSEPSKFLSPVSNRSDSLGSNMTSIFLQTNFFLKRTSLNNGSLKSSRHGIPMISTVKSSAKYCTCSSHLVTSRQLSSVASLNPQLLKSPFLRTNIPSRHFSLEGFYAALAQSPPVQTAKGLLLDIHQYLPWWAVICVSTLAVRSLVVLPLAVHQAQVVARLAAVNAEMVKIAPELNKEVELARKMTGWDKNQAKRVFKIQLRQIYRRSLERDNCHPFKMVLLVFFQMPLWVCLSVSLRTITAMAQAGYPSAIDMRSEGTLWFSDLTAPEPFLLPLILLAVNLTLTEVHALRHVGKGGLLQKVILNGSRLIIFVVAAAAIFNPSSVAFYWLCSSSFGLFQGLLLMSPRVRRALAIPKMASESPTPYRDMARNLQIKVARIKAMASR